MTSRAELSRQGWAASRAGNHAEALALWSELRALDAAYFPAIMGTAAALLGLGRPEELEGLAAAEEAPAAAIFRASLAQHREDWPAALAAWQAARAGGLGQPAVGLGITTALLRLGRAREAIAEAASGLARQPENPTLRAMQVQAGKRLAEQMLAAAPPLALRPWPAPAPAPDGAARRALVLEFESLGRNCELGMLQRKFGAEPLGLLRWGATWVDSLLDLLANRLEGVGDPAQTRIDISENGREYLTRDTRYRFTGHIPIGGPPPDRETMDRKQMQRLGFLARMLRETLETQSRILVYQKPDLTEQEISAIYGALGEYGPNFLLCVRQADAEHPPGHIAVADRLVVGYLDRHGSGKTGEWIISVDHWLSFCQVASARRAALLAAAAAEPAMA